MKPLATPRLYALADGTALGLDRLPEAVEALAKAGIEWIQIRAKQAADDQLFALLEACLTRVEGRAVALWVNDRPDLAALFPVAGVHLGQDDLPPVAARQVLSRGSDTRRYLIGRSTHDLEQAEAAAADDDVDVIAFGPIFQTASKAQPDPVVGLEALSEVRKRVTKPLIAIGGIDAENLASVLAAGADTVAVLGAICHGDVERNCHRLRSIAEEAS